MMRNTRTGFVMASVCALAAMATGMGCGGGESTGEGGGYVLLDSDARQAGVSLEVGDRIVTNVLPVAVGAADRVSLVTAGTEVPVTVARGELVFVEGARAHVSHLQIGKQVAIDQLRLTGEQGAANELASQLGAKVALDDQDHTTWRLNVPDVFAASASAHVPEHLFAASPILLSETPAIAANAARTNGVAPNAVARMTAPSPNLVSPSAPAVVLAVADTATVASSATSHALFAPAASCEGVAGTWRSRVYSDRHQGYYDFTLHVQQQGASVKGSVVAEMWSGSTAESEPPSACAGERHATVVESASGTVSADGAMHFNSKNWRIASHACGERVLGYSPDKFEIPLASGATTAHAVVSDEAVWSDGLPLEMTRVSCK